MNLSIEYFFKAFSHKSVDQDKKMFWKLIIYLSILGIFLSYISNIQEKNKIDQLFITIFFEMFVGSIFVRLLPLVFLIKNKYF